MSRLLSISVFQAIVLSLLLMQPAYAASPDIVISQVYGGGGNSGAPLKNDYVELFNRSATTVSLTGLSIQYASAAGTGNFGSNPVTLLNGMLQPGQYYLVQLAGGENGVALPIPDVTGSANMSAKAGKVALVASITGLACNGGSTPCTPAQLAQIVDLVGYGAGAPTPPNFLEGAGAAPAASNTTSVFRINHGCTDSDDNAADFTVGSPLPRNIASPLNPCGDAAPFVSSTVPINGASNIMPGADISITFSEPVDVTGDWFTLECATSGLHTSVVSGGSTTFTLNPDAEFAPGEKCTLTVYAAGVNDQDTNDPPDDMLVDFSASFTTLGICALPSAPIYNIQGSGLSARSLAMSPLMAWSVKL